MKKRYLTPLLLVVTLASCEPTSVSFALKANEGECEIHTETQLDRFINNEHVLDNYYNNVTYVDGLMPNTDYTKPGYVELKWTATPDRGSIDSYVVKISENEDMSESLVYSSSKTSFKATNLKINTQYYWSVSYKSFTSKVGSFKTNNTVIRGVDVDGVKNVRDLGSFFSIKQGLLYRGGEFENYNKTKQAPVTNITKKGIKTLKDELKIKTEIDLRKDDDSNENCSITESKVPGATYLSLPMFYGGKNLLTYTDSTFDNPARIKDIFEVFADEDNYPIYFHCSQGKDRTGIIAYLLESLLGQSQDNLYKDYLYSNLADISFQMKKTGIDTQYGATLSDYRSSVETEEGITLTHQQTVYRYLSEVIGVKTSDLDKIISFLEL